MIVTDSGVCWIGERKVLAADADPLLESNVVDRHIRELRVKRRDDWRPPQFIETMAGKGSGSSRGPSRIAAAKPRTEVAQPLKRASDGHWK